MALRSLVFAFSAGWLGLAITHPTVVHADLTEGCEEEIEDDRPPGPTVAMSVSVLPRVDGWDGQHGHRSGWGIAGGIDLSPWESRTEVHLEVSFLTNQEHRLISFDLGLKVPFHSGVQWDVHGVIGPALAFEHFQITHADGTTSSEGAFVVGMIAGVGTTWWFHPHVGATVDLNYRVLGGEGIAHRLFSAIGITTRW